MASDWFPDSWRSKRVDQEIVYPDRAALRESVENLAQLPPLVTSWEIENLKSQLAEAARGNQFLLQGGDCAENFHDCRPDAIACKLKILLKMSLVLIYCGKKPIIRVGRLAGQYAKPRSSDIETRGETTLPSFRGHLVNRLGFTPEERTPDPKNLLRAYERSAMTLNFVRGLIDGGFADLRHPEHWELGFVAHSDMAKEYRQMVDQIGDAVTFMETIGGQSLGHLNRVDFYTSHEGLHLEYEESQTRQVPHRSGWYNLTTHYPWIGERTRLLDGAHLEYFRGIANPIGVKIGPSITPKTLLELIDHLNPENEPGRLTFIHRFGADQIEKILPPLVEAVLKEGRNVLWCSDPMHGNTTTAHNGRKTRSFDAILTELKRAFAIHRKMGSVLGGVHFELTGENVTECTGGARGLTESDLDRAYLSDVDPRLNYEQALEMAFLIGRNMAG